jgi:hypothetical protein
MDYLDRELVTKTQVVTESLSLFPTVTFYNLFPQESFNKREFKKDDIILSCSFNEDTDDECLKLVELKDGEYNNTYFQFNYRKNAKVIQNGRSNGLKLKIFAGFPKDYDNYNEKFDAISFTWFSCNCS